MRVREPRRDLDLPEKSPGAEHRSQLGEERLDRDEATVFQVAGEEHTGHSPAPELALDHVALPERAAKTFQDICAHGAPAPVRTAYVTPPAAPGQARAGR